MLPSPSSLELGLRSPRQSPCFSEESWPGTLALGFLSGLPQRACGMESRTPRDHTHKCSCPSLHSPTSLSSLGLPVLPNATDTQGCYCTVLFRRLEWPEKCLNMSSTDPVYFLDTSDTWLGPCMLDLRTWRANVDIGCHGDQHILDRAVHQDAEEVTPHSRFPEHAAETAPGEEEVAPRGPWPAASTQGVVSLGSQVGLQSVTFRKRAKQRRGTQPRGCSSGRILRAELPSLVSFRKPASCSALCLRRKNRGAVWGRSRTARTSGVGAENRLEGFGRVGVSACSSGRGLSGRKQPGERKRLK